MEQNSDENGVIHGIKMKTLRNDDNTPGFTSLPAVDKPRTRLGKCINHGPRIANDYCQSSDKLKNGVHAYDNVCFPKSDIDKNKQEQDLTVNEAQEKGSGDDVDKEESPSATCRDPEYRYKIIATGLIFWNATMMGFGYGQMGPALPDLRMIGHVPLQEATWLFTGFAIGYMSGSLLAGIIQDRFNMSLMLFLYTTVNAVFMGILPLLPSFVAMVIARVAYGIAFGGQDTLIHAMLFSIWFNDSGPFIQTLHCIFAFGGILSPLITTPFISTSDSSLQNMAAVVHSNLSLENITSDDLINSTSVPPISAQLETNVHYAFLITAMLTVSTALPFLVLYLTKRRVKKTTQHYNTEIVNKEKLPMKIKYVVLCIGVINSFIATATIDMFPNFVTTFVIDQLDMTQQYGSTLTSLYFAAYGLGNLIGIFLLRHFTSTKWIAFSYVTSGLAFTGLLISVIYGQTEVIWVMIPLCGFTMSAILPTLFTWTQENVTPITTRVASSFLISGSAGVIVNPLLIGYMMDVYSPMWFVYLSFGELTVCAVLFATSLTLSKVFAAHPAPEADQNPSVDVSVVQGTTPRETIVFSLETLHQYKAKTEQYDTMNYECPSVRL